MQRIGYLDGLRALAILGVVAFHCNVPHVPGGYLGVDIFFVLSGYLIIGMIQRALDRKDLSLLQFYCARALRIGPPLALVVFFTLSLASLIGLSPFELKWYGRSAAATMALVPNIFFSHEFGYFEPTAELQPFLHMWSLGVEEQFYAVAPLVLASVYFLSSDRPVRRFICVTLLVLTFVVSLAGFLIAPYQSAFYLMPWRMWEFAAGGFVAVAVDREQQVPKWLAEVCACIGLLLIGKSMFFIAPGTRFPGPIGVLPVLGTALVILAGHISPKSLFIRLLGHPLLVATGLISYSWYLWHWSLLVLLRAYLVGHRYLWLDLVVSGLGGAVLATITYYSIERPCRALRHSPRIGALTKPLLAASAISVALSVFICLHYETKMEARAHLPKFAAIQDAFGMPNQEPCTPVTITARNESVDACRLGTGTHTLVIWGDSLAGSLVYAANQLAQTHDTRVLVLWKAGCIPLLDVDVAWLGVPHEDCRKRNMDIVDLLASGDFGTSPALLIASAWPQYASREGLTVAIPAGSDNIEVNYGDLILKSLAKTLRVVTPHVARTLVMGPSPLWRYSVPLCLFAVQERNLQPSYCTERRPEIEAERVSFTPAIEVASRGFGNVEYVDPMNAFCNQAECSPVRGGVILFSDTVHFSNQGSEYLFDFLAPSLSWLLEQPQSSGAFPSDAK